MDGYEHQTKLFNTFVAQLDETKDSVKYIFEVSSKAKQFSEATEKKFIDLSSSIRHIRNWSIGALITILFFAPLITFFITQMATTKVEVQIKKLSDNAEELLKKAEANGERLDVAEDRISDLLDTSENLSQLRAAIDERKAQSKANKEEIDQLKKKVQQLQEQLNYLNQ